MKDARDKRRASPQVGVVADTVIDGRYQLLGLLGTGGMGRVFEARHLYSGRTVALKMLLRDAPSRDQAGALTRFRREARAAGAIDSQHVVQVTDTGVDRVTGNPYIVMERLQGEDLRALLKRSERLPIDLVLRIAAQACIGLARAHEQQIIHRDIKPANIFLSRADAGTGDQIIVKLLDFGIAKLRVDPWSASDQPQLTASGSMLGSPLYMSPEQALGQRDLDHRADLWSLGVVMYEALCGEPPHGKNTVGALILRICSQPATPLHERVPGIPDAVSALVQRALALDPDQRFPSAREMHSALMALLEGDARIPGGAVAQDGAAPMRALGDDASTVSSGSSMGTGTGTGTGTLTSDISESGVPKGMQTSTVVLAQRSARRRLGVPLLAVALGAALLAAWPLATQPFTEERAQPVTSGAIPPQPAAIPTPPMPPMIEDAPAVATAGASAKPGSSVAVASESHHAVLSIVAPATAAVTVDDVPVPVRDGAILLHGELGSVHVVRLRVGANTIATQVVLASGGPVPARVAWPSSRARARTVGAAATPPAASVEQTPSETLTIDRSFTP